MLRKNIFLRLAGGFLFSLLVLILVLFLAVWALSPFLFRIVAKDALQPYDLFLSEKSQVRYNPFMSRLKVDTLSWRSPSDQPFAIQSVFAELDLHQLWHRSLKLKRLEVIGGVIDIYHDEEKTVVAGFSANTNTPEADAETEAPVNGDGETDTLPVSIDLSAIRFRDIKIRASVLGRQHTIIIDHWDVDNVAIVDRDIQAVSRLAMQINGANLQLESHLHWRKDVSSLRLVMSLDKLDLAQWGYLLPDVPKLEGLLSLHVPVNVELQGEEVRLASDVSRITMDALAVDVAEMNYQNKQFKAVVKDLSLVLLGGDQVDIQSQYALENRHGAVHMSSTDDVLAQWQAFEGRDGEVRVRMKDGALDQLSLSLPHFELTEWLGSQRKGVQGQPPKPLVGAQALVLSGLAFAENRLSLDEVAIDGLVAHVNLDADKNISTLVALSDNPDLDTPAEAHDSEAASVEGVDGVEPIKAVENVEGEGVPVPESPAQEVGVAIKKIIVGENSQVIFSDLSVVPSFEKKYIVNRLNIGPVNTLNPEQLTHIDLDLKDEKFLSLKVKGETQLLLPTEKTHLTIDVKELSLPEMSPYIEPILGFDFQTGALDSEIDVGIVEEMINGKTRFKLRGADMSGSKNQKSDSVVGKAAIPMNVALGMLKDKRGDIELKVPVEGNINDPSFGVNSFFALIARKAIMSQTKNYLMQTFVPYANVVSVAMAAGSFALKVRFEDLEYPPSVTQPTEAQNAYIEQFVGLMKSKPKVRVKLCPIVTLNEVAGEGVADSEVMRQLKVLGQARASEFKRTVVALGLESERLLLCKYRLDEREGAKPRMELKSSK